MLWQIFHQGGIPRYLARHYWWAYLWRPGIWFFDHETIINSILFGQYDVLSAITAEKATNVKPGSNVLQLSCVYGHLSGALNIRVSGSHFHITDVSRLQLQTVKRKMKNSSPEPAYSQMNSERTAYADNSFDTVVIYFLLHEMPPEARANTLAESLRILKPGGKLIITEYGELSGSHVLHTNRLLRKAIEWFEPYLASFWGTELKPEVAAICSRENKVLLEYRSTPIYEGFYRVVECSLMP